MEPNLSLSGVFGGRDHMCIGEFGLYPFWHTIFDTWSVFTCSWFICPAALKPCVKWFCWRPALTKFRWFSPMFWNTLPRILPKPCSDLPNEPDLRPQLANSALATSDRSWNIFRSFLLNWPSFSFSAFYRTVDLCSFSMVFNSLASKCLWPRVTIFSSVALLADPLFIIIMDVLTLSRAPRQRSCQVSERRDDYNTQSRGFETSRDLAVRRLTA